MSERPGTTIDPVATGLRRPSTACQPEGADRRDPARAWLVPWLWGTLAAAAAIYQGYNLWIGLHADDTNHLESTLILIVARRLRDGFGTIYGPFSGANPLVLIHAPLYYRLATAGAWGLARLGFNPTTAAMAAGRGLSALGMAGTLAAAWRLARADGATRRAGAWAALLVAAAPVFGSFPATVRPDTLALAFQTAGVALAMGWICGGCRSARDLMAAYACFGLAVGARQNFVVSAALTSAFVAVEVIRGRARIGAVAAAHALAAAIVVGYYALEQAATGGRMAHAVFEVAGELRRFNYASWAQVGKVAIEVAKESLGLIALAGAAVVAAPRRAAGSRLDGMLWVLLLGESAATAWLCLNSTGSWVNYAMPPILYAAALAARAVDRAIGGSGLPAWRLAPIVAAGMILLATDCRYVAISARSRLEEADRLASLFADPAVAGRPASARYFVARPHYNRQFGRADLAHDDWLYTAFERASAAEPRSGWLRDALLTGPVEVVIVAGEEYRDPERVEGLRESLTALGYCEVGQHGLYRVWERP